MSLYKKLFTQTLIYGLAAVFPKIIGFLMVRFYINWMPDNAYGSYSLIFSWIMFLNVILSFGMETTFFRFYNKIEDKKSVINISLWVIIGMCFLLTVPTLLFIDPISNYFKIDSDVTLFLLGILLLDALVVVPFALLRANEQSKKYTLVKIINVLLYSGLTVFFLYALPTYFSQLSIYIKNFEVGYAFLANLIGSLVCLLLVIRSYKYLFLPFKVSLAKQMLMYSFPVMIGGLAFVVNETFDKIILEFVLPKDLALLEVARYSAIYKLGLFMVLFRMAYSLGIEPFFFNYAKNQDAQLKYATITKYFILFGSIMMLVIIVFADILKILLVPKETYWVSMNIVPYVILANFMLGIYTNLSVWYKIQDKTHIGMYISIIGAIATIVLNILLIPYFGALGCAITTLIAYLIMMTISYVLGQKNYPIPYDKKAIILYLGGSTLLSYLYFFMFRENYLVGFTFIIVFLSVVLWNERTLIKQLIPTKKT